MIRFKDRRDATIVKVGASLYVLLHGHGTNACSSSSQHTPASSFARCLGCIYSMYSTNLIKTQASVDYSTGDIQYIRSWCPAPFTILVKEQFKTSIQYPGYSAIFRFLIQGDTTLSGIKFMNQWDNTVITHIQVFPFT